MESDEEEAGEKQGDAVALTATSEDVAAATMLRVMLSLTHELYKQ